jgi:hypothetical protein
MYFSGFLRYTGLVELYTEVGVFTFGAIWYQAFQSKKATEAMERSTGITWALCVAVVGGDCSLVATTADPYLLGLLGNWAQ